MSSKKRRAGNVVSGLNMFSGRLLLELPLLFVSKTSGGCGRLLLLLLLLLPCEAAVAVPAEPVVLFARRLPLLLFGARSPPLKAPLLLLLRLLLDGL